MRHSSRDYSCQDSPLRFGVFSPHQGVVDRLIKIKDRIFPLLLVNIGEDGLTEKFVSVVVPSHGRVDLLIETLDSLVRQTSSRFEVVLADDSHHSTEREQIQNAVQAASQKRDISFRYIFSRPGLGQADNTNQGIRNASGQYIRILHSDDIIHPRTIEFELSHLDKLTKENVLALHDVVVFSDEKPTFSDPQTPEIRDRQFFIDKWLSTRTALPSSMIFSKSLLKKCGPMNRKYNFLCDWEFFYRLVLGAEEIIHFPRGYIGWRKHSNSVTGNSWFLHYSEFSDLMEFMKDDLKNRGIKPNGGFRHFTRQGMRYRYSRIFSDYGNLSLREKITNIPKIARSFVCDPFFYRIVITTVILDPSRQLIRKSWKPVQ